MEDNRKAVLCILSCVAMWAFVPITSRLGQRNLDNHQYLFWSNALSLAVLLGATLAARKTGCFKAYGPRDLAAAAGLGFLGAFLYYLLLYFGYARAQGLEVLVIQYTWPIFIVVFSALILREAVSWRHALACALGFLGVAIVLTKGRPGSVHLDNISVDLVVLLAASVFGLFSVLSKKMDFEPFTASTLFFVSGTAFSYVSMLIFSSFRLPDGGSIIPILGNGIFINGISYVVWLKGLGYAKASTTAPLLFLTPILGSILVVVILKEAFLPVYLIGLALVVTAGLISQSGRG